MNELKTVNCEQLMTEPLKPIEFVVDNLITQGLFIPAGAPKIGKSWLALGICLSVAKGETVLNAKQLKAQPCIFVWGTAGYEFRIGYTR